MEAVKYSFDKTEELNPFGGILCSKLQKREKI